MPEERIKRSPARERRNGTMGAVPARPVLIALLFSPDDEAGTVKRRPRITIQIEA